MADALTRLKSLRALAMVWFDRQAAYAARALTQAALDKAGGRQPAGAAEDALRMIAVRHRDEVFATADATTRGPAGLEILLGAADRWAVLAQVGSDLVQRAGLYPAAAHEVPARHIAAASRTPRKVPGNTATGSSSGWNWPTGSRRRSPP